MGSALGLRNSQMQAAACPAAAGDQDRFDPRVVGDGGADSAVPHVKGAGDLADGRAGMLLEVSMDGFSELLAIMRGRPHVGFSVGSSVGSGVLSPMM
jgi:hypothetical protein